MNVYEKKLNQFLKDNGSDAQILIYDKTCHSVEEASRNANVDPTNFIKSICMIDSNDELIVAIVKGEDRASSARISKSLGIEKPRVATPEEMLKKTGYPCGGTPPFGYKANYLIDTKVMDKESVYGGGGSEYALVKVCTIELKRLNNGKVIKISK